VVGSIPWCERRLAATDTSEGENARRPAFYFAVLNAWLVELVTDYLEGALPGEAGALFEEHLNFCGSCASYLDQLRVTIATVGRIEQTDVPPDMRDRLLTAFRDRRRT
jgi:Putative zinc-finger